MEGAMMGFMGDGVEKRSDTVKVSVGVRPAVCGCAGPRLLDEGAAGLADAGREHVDGRLALDLARRGARALHDIKYTRVT
jgi:hypothetical protein